MHKKPKYNAMKYTVKENKFGELQTTARRYTLRQLSSCSSLPRYIYLDSRFYREAATRDQR